MNTRGSAALSRSAAAASGPSTRAAFFDVDNTIMVGASMFHFARGLASRKFFTTRDLCSFALKQVRFRVGGKERGGDIAHTRESALAFVAGKRAEELVAICEEIYDEQMAGQLWAGTRALVDSHLAAGDAVWLVTATPVELASIIARRLGLTGALGTIAATVDGVYTGRLVGDVLHGSAKAQAVRQLAAREGLDLSLCSAYSDSINDLPMLQSVGHPVAINPDSALRAHARDEGWELHDFRTGRRAVKIALPTAIAAGAAVAGALGARALTERSGGIAPQTIGTVRRPVSARSRCAVRAFGTAHSGWSRVRGR
jgi:HAD superfamily hydrolase (TIGR01490 family)